MSRDLSNGSLKTGRQRADWRTYIRISSKRERGREEKSKSRDLSNRSLKTDGETESGERSRSSSKRERGREEKSKSRDLSNRSLKTDGETESGEPT